ncbi:MAG: NADH-quinone oxidoreductase subunit M [Candidatus Eisenbacteria bacterium]|uniref:NADH-quinone oxidoreductase subunit M n=1 Tax=Eiseniibacteriota bacterium TaxID=2212470 RepID=A0A956RPW4_UNCEI|nr:NADH-quinone oxidoreductase subunit M [Candidatus Eisenbacteria bacterium]
MESLLSVIVFLPLVAGLLLMLVPKDQHQVFRWGSFVAMLATFGLSLALVPKFQTIAGMQFVTDKPWVPDFGIHYHLGLDGISFFLLLLTNFLGPILVLSAFSAVQERVKEFYILLLVLQTGMLGAFAALDLFLFYIFWELMLLPMYLLIGVWGGKRRIYAAVKFVLYTIVGSLLMLVAILVLYFQHHTQTGVYTFDLMALYHTQLSGSTQAWLFAAFALAFAIKVPVFPLHTWLPDAHVEAPTAGSVVLAGVLLKMGTYGFLRFAIPLFPAAAVQAQTLFLVLAVIGIIYGALVAMVQTDVKKLVAYSSVSHLGYVMLGLFSFNLFGSSGALYQMLGHGLSTGGLFLLVGMIYERRHTREISEFGGLATGLPFFTFAFVFVTLSSVGLPGLNGFVGEFLVLLGAFGENRLMAILAASGVVLGAVYMLWLVRRFLFGPLTNEANAKLPDLNVREWLVLAPIFVMIVVMGVLPRPFLSRMEPSLEAALEPLHRARAALEQAEPRQDLGSIELEGIGDAVSASSGTESAKGIER